MTVCRECGIDKPDSEYYVKNKSKCKACWRARAKAGRLANIDKVRAHDRARGLRQPASYFKQWREMNKAKYRAHNAVNNALRDGKICAEPCFICGSKAEAHHPDYSQPLDVVWLCPPHHKQAHALARSL